MIEYLKYRAKLNKLFRQKERLRASFANDIRKAKKDGKPREDIASIEYESYFEEKMINEEIDILATDHLIQKARRRFIPIPAHDVEGMWEQCDTINQRSVLTSQGISQVRTLLRAERKEQIEYFATLFSFLIGFIGAVTGLVAVIRK